MKAPEIILALDGMTDSEAIQLVDRIGGKLLTYKVGLELFTRYGPGFIEQLHCRDKGVFLDVKYHDIPATVGQAVRGAVSLGVRLVNIHAAGGEEMMRAAALGRGNSSTRVLAVTVLTSESGEAVADLVLDRANMAATCGLDGVVASVAEARAIKAACGEKFLVVTPGIRPSGTARDDQKRVATPAEAMVAGADAIVVGRPVTRSDDPIRALESIEAELLDG